MVIFSKSNLRRISICFMTYLIEVFVKYVGQEIYNETSVM